MALALRQAASRGRDCADMFELKAVPRTSMLWAVLILLVFAVACGASSQEPVTARVIVTDVQVSVDGKTVESLTVRTDDGEQLTLRLGDDIEPAAWSPSHLLSHADLGESLGLKIGVTYVHTADSVIAIRLSE